MNGNHQGFGEASFRRIAPMRFNRKYVDRPPKRDKNIHMIRTNVPKTNSVPKKYSVPKNCGSTGPV